ncbi:MAG: PD-(D/E)XK nuclease family protein [Janthinobacterium lividum]
MEDLLDSRLPFAWLRERDIDLLLCSELHARGEVARLLASRTGDPAAAVEGAWVSHAEVDGESDLVVALSGPTGRTVVLIENKISAVFQPDQGARYKARAARWEGTGVRAVTVLVAPAGYHGRDGSEHFEIAISYEEIAEVAERSGDRRSMFFAEALLGAVDSYRRGYIATPDTAVSDMWMACWEIAARLTPKLRLKRPGPKPGRSTWFYFREADGFGRGTPAVVVYKAEHGQADLQFAGMGAAELAARSVTLLEPDMRVVPASKSASVRVAVPEIDFNGLVERQEAAIRLGLETCERLRVLYVERFSD